MMKGFLELKIEAKSKNLQKFKKLRNKISGNFINFIQIVENYVTKSLKISKKILIFYLQISKNYSLNILLMNMFLNKSKY